MFNYYYKGNGLRVWLGDFCYAYNINFKKLKLIKKRLDFINCLLYNSKVN